MGQKAETLLKITIQAELRKIQNIWVVKTQQVSVRGIPDLLICYQGKFYAYELKTDSGKLDELQKYNLQKIEQAGGVARVVTPSNYKHILESDFCHGICSKDERSKSPEPKCESYFSEEED